MGLQLIYMNGTGEKKQVSDHLAFDTSLQKTQNFFPCDEQGQPVGTPDEYAVKASEKKSDPVAAAKSEMREAVIIPPSEGGKSFAEQLEDEERAKDANKTPEQIESEINATILKLHSEGKTPKEISKEVGKHWKTVESVINKSK